MQGGGNFGDLYTPHQRLRESMVAAFPDRRIIFMPQTVKYQDRTRMEWSACLLSLHPDLHIIARDKDSYDTLTDQMGLVNCYLHTDSAFGLQPIVSSLVSAIGAPVEKDAIYLMRHDAEAGQAIPGGMERQDWSVPDNLAGLVDLGPDLQSIDAAREVFQTEFDVHSWRRLCAAVRLFSSGRRIVTDRLHGHILAMLMGKPHDFYDNSYGKNSAFCLSWTYRSPLVHFINPPDYLSKAVADHVLEPVS
jgi:pyruvyl transferase EpsO